MSPYKHSPQKRRTKTHQTLALTIASLSRKEANCWLVGWLQSGGGRGGDAAAHGDDAAAVGDGVEPRGAGGRAPGLPEDRRRGEVSGSSQQTSEGNLYNGWRRWWNLGGGDELERVLGEAPGHRWPPPHLLHPHRPCRRRRRHCRLRLHALSFFLFSFFFLFFLFFFRMKSTITRGQPRFLPLFFSRYKIIARPTTSRVGLGWDGASAPV